MAEMSTESARELLARHEAELDRMDREEQEREAARAVLAAEQERLAAVRAEARRLAALDEHEAARAARIDEVTARARAKSDSYRRGRLRAGLPREDPKGRTSFEISPDLLLDGQPTYKARKPEPTPIERLDAAREVALQHRANENENAARMRGHKPRAYASVLPREQPPEPEQRKPRQPVPHPRSR